MVVDVGLLGLGVDEVTDIQCRCSPLHETSSRWIEVTDTAIHSHMHASVTRYGYMHPDVLANICFHMRYPLLRYPLSIRSTSSSMTAVQ